MSALSHTHDEVESTLLRTLELVRKEFLETPVSRLTPPETARLFALDAEVCALMLERLLERHVLLRTQYQPLSPAQAKPPKGRKAVETNNFML